MRRQVVGSLVIAVALQAQAAFAGTFDPGGTYSFDPDAVAKLDFTKKLERYLPDEADDKCKPEAYAQMAVPDALEGGGVLRLDVVPDCAERFVVHLPKEQASYRATFWMRHGAIGAQMRVEYPDDSGVGGVEVRMFPTGRTTSDGWVELTSNEFPVDGALATRVYLRLFDYANLAGTEVDALEIVRAGEFAAPKACTGHGDASCGPEAICSYGRCRLGRLAVPPLPDDGLKDGMVDVLESRLRLFFGGRLTREHDLPVAIATMEKMRKAKSAWAFWGGFARAIRELHDWHTSARVPFNAGGTSHRLNACFFEGDADASHQIWPSHPQYADILVSHSGVDAAGLQTGDRLVAVDGLHPIEWAHELIDVDLGYHVACDPDNFADLAEQLGGPTWSGGALILRYATTLTVIRCDPATGTCSGIPETLKVADLGSGTDGPDVACDNRPFYHLQPTANPDDTPDPSNHYVFGHLYRGAIVDTAPTEAIFGLTWDTLYGGGDPNGYVNKGISDAITDWKANARGVILDHRAGNGGTLDAAENVTKLVRPEEPLAVIRMPMEIAGFDGPIDDQAGLAIFEKFKTSDNNAYLVGSPDHDPLLPVALITHRDGSASDYMPFGMKGAPKVRIFGPHPTAGAFSTFIEFFYWNGLGFQIASGDTIAFDGRSLIGHGVEPDVTLLPKQSDLLAGKDTLHEAALAWVRQELKP